MNEKDPERPLLSPQLEENDCTAEAALEKGIAEKPKEFHDKG